MALSAQYSATRRLTQLEKALAARLHETGQPLITPYRLFHELRGLYTGGYHLRQRKQTPDLTDLALRRRNLVRAGVLIADPDYHQRAYRIVANSDRSAEEICCLIDRFCYVAHLTAMARYGLTDRRPTDLHLRTPTRELARRLLAETMIEDYGGTELTELGTEQILRPQAIGHPATVRGRGISLVRTAHPGKITPIRGMYARIAEIGQTFADMLEEPKACGGMAHVLEVWQTNAEIYLDDIIAAVERTPRPISKVRAGYILNEYLGLADNRVERWSRYAQRGSSRRLDPGRPFASNYSEKWMLSLNVD